MTTSKDIDRIMNEMNDRAKTEGRYLTEAFWEIPSQSDSILKVPVTPEAEQRLAALRVRRLERKKKIAQQPVPAEPVQDAAQEPIPETSAEEMPARGR
jgi:hypothetical protein